MTTDSESIHVALVTPQKDLGHRWIENVGCDMESDTPKVTFKNRDIFFQPVSQLEDVHQLPDQVLPVLLMRFVDAVSLKHISELYKSRPELSPVCAFIYRNEDESDFKMSCPTCGQKLWVPDADIGKRGQCPHCQKGFNLPAQDEHIREYLSLPSHCTIGRMYRNNPESIEANLFLILQAALQRSTSVEFKGGDANKNDTMQVKVPLKDSDSDA